MVAKRAVRKQQDTSRLRRPRVRNRRDTLSALRPITEACNAALADCLRSGAPEAVHRVRTGSRRGQAMAEALLRETVPAKNELQRTARAWLRQLKKVRRAAASVRDLDVHRQLLQKWLPKTEEGHVATPLEAQAELLDNWLRNERRRIVPEMQKQLEKRQGRMLQRQDDFFACLTAAAPGKAEPARSAEAVALEDYVGAAEAMPLLHAENLHDFRKAIKKARYVAESGPGDRSHVASTLKQLQDAIGDWHDWHCLVEQAKAMLHRNSSGDAQALSRGLESEADRHFAAALMTAQTTRGLLFGEWMTAIGDLGPAKRPPAASMTARRSQATKSA